MAVAPGSFLAAVLLLVSSGLHRSSSLPPCPDSCSCQRAPLLNCSSSGFSSVPQHIPDSVTELDLSHNLLDSVTLDRPRHDLRRVWLGNNRIAHLSLCIERNLGGHYVRGRRLKRRLSPWRGRGCVSWAPTLQLLSVERNQLEQLPQGLEGSESLQVLQLSFNRISTLRPGELNHLQQLKELHLQHNLITSLHPQMFQDLAQLQVLDLSFNMLTSLHPLAYLSLRNIGADVMLGGNRWQCDCSMRSLRRRMAYDSSRGLQTWSVVCASPSILSGRDLLQLEEDDLNCFSPENGPELHQDVTVYKGSEILLSCATQDSVWWTPSGQAPVSQPQAGLVISDITETETGLYVCVSEEYGVMSVFNLQISKIGGARRKARSLPRTSQIIPQGIPNRTGQERNQRATPSNLALAVCLSVFITFLIAFILGVLARPCIDALWGRVTKKKRASATNSVSSVEQRQYDNEAYFDGEGPEHMGTHRERRVTFSTIDFREDGNVKYYDTVAGGNQGRINNDAVIECEGAEAERDTNTAGDSGSENSVRQSSPENNLRDGRDLSGVTDAGRLHNIEFEHIPDPVELVKRRSLSSCSGSSLSDKVFNEDQMIRGDHSTPKTPQLAEDSVQQRADSSSARNVEVPQISIEGTSEPPGFSSEPFADWSPYTNNTNLTNMWQENEEQFEFSDSVRSTSARSSGVLGSSNESKLIVAPSSDKQKTGDMSSSSSYVSDDEPTQYIVNSNHEEEDIERNHNQPEVSSAVLNQGASFEQQIHGVDPITPLVGFNQGDTQRSTVRPEDSFSSHSSDSDSDDYRVKKEHVPSLAVTSHSKSLDTRAPSPPAAYSSSSSSESEAEITNLNVKHNTGIKINEPETLSTDMDRQCIPQIKSRVDINVPSPASDSSSSDESMDETTNHRKQQEQVGVDMAGLPSKEHQSVSHDDMKPQWPALDLDHPTTRFDFSAPSPPTDSSSSSDSEDETTHHIEKQKQGATYMARVPVEVSQNVRHDPQPQWPALDLEDTTHVKRRLDVKAPSPPSSSSSDSEDQTIHHTERPGKVDIAGLPFQESQTGTHEPHTRWPVVDLEDTTRVKRHLDIKAPSPASDSSSSSDSDDKPRGYMKKQEQGQMNMDKVSQNMSHDPQPQWPVVDFDDTTRVKRRLDIKASSPASDSSSSSDSEDEKTGYTEKQKPWKVDNAGLPFEESQTRSQDPDTRWPALDLEDTMRIKRRVDVKAPSPASDSSSSSDSENEPRGHIKKQEQGQMNMDKVSQNKSLEDTMRIKRRLDVKAPSPLIDSSSSSDSDDETTGRTEKQSPGKVDIAGLPFKESQTRSHDPDARFPALDLEDTMRIKRRLDVKAPLPPSSSSSDSEDETTHQIKKQKQGAKYMARLPVEVSQNASHDTQPQWPALDLEDTTRVKRRLDIKAPSAPPDSSSSSDSEDETPHHTQKPGKVDNEGLPFQESQTRSHDPDTRLPVVDLEHTTRVKRRLDIKAPSPPPDSSSSSDSGDETKIERPGMVGIAGLSYQESLTVSRNPDTTWPSIALEHIPRIKRSLEFKATSPPPDSSSSSDNDDETSHQESQTRSQDPDIQWPVIDLEHTTCIKRRLDIKAPSPPPDSSSSSDSEDETKMERPGVVGIARLPYQETISRDPDTTWPSIDLEHIPRIKRRLDLKATSPPPGSFLSGGSTNHTVEGKRGESIKISPCHSSSSSDEQEEGLEDSDSRWPRLDLSSALHVKKRLDIKARSPPPESSSRSDHESEVGMTNLPVKVETKLSAGVPYINRRLDIRAPSPQPGPFLSSVSPGSRQSESNSSRSNSEDEYRDHAKIGMEVSATSKATEKEFIRSPKTPMINISPKTDIQLEKYRAISDEVGDKTSNISTTPEINPELQSRWATMNLGISRFRKRLEITSHTHEPPNLPSTPPPDSPSSSSSESGTGSKSSRTRRTRWRAGRDDNSGHSAEATERVRKDYSLPTSEEKSNPDTKLTGTPHLRRYLDFKVREKAPATPPQLDQTQSQTGMQRKAGVELKSQASKLGEESYSVQPHLSLTNIPHIRRALDIRAPSQRESSSSSNSEDEKIDHSVPDLSLGVPRITRRLNVKAPSPEPSNSASSCSDSENQVTGYTVNQGRHASNMSGMTDDDSLITYKRVIMKASLPQSSSYSPSGKGQTVDHTRQRHMGTEMQTKKVTSMSFDDVVKKRLEQPRSTTDVDLPPEIKWTGVGRQLSDLPIPSARRHLGVGLSAPPAEPELDSPPDSSNSSSSESDDNIKQDRGKADVPLMHKHSSLGAHSVSLASSRTPDKFDSPPSSTNEIFRAVSEDRNERKGLSALKAMSSERRKWDPDANLDMGASPLFDDHGQHGDGKGIRPQAKQPLTQLDRRRATDLLYDIPRYRRHDIGGLEPPLGAPPPIPATPPPYEAVGLTWRSTQSSKKPGLEGTRSYQSKNTEESDGSPHTSQKLAVYFDSSRVNISEV